MLGKDEDESVGETNVSEDSMRISSVIVNIFRKGMKAEPLQLRLQWDGGVTEAHQEVRRHNAHERYEAAIGHDQLSHSREVGYHWWVHPLLCTISDKVDGRHPYFLFATEFTSHARAAGEQ